MWQRLALGRRGNARPLMCVFLKIRMVIAVGFEQRLKAHRQESGRLAGVGTGMHLPGRGRVPERMAHMFGPEAGIGEDLLRRNKATGAPVHDDNRGFQVLIGSAVA